MIDYKYADLYYEDSIDKQLKIEAEDGSVITNEDIFSEAMTLDESLCSDSSLNFGCCEASKFYIKIANRFTQMYGQWLTVSETIDGNEDDPFVFGKYKVQSDKPTADRAYREITAYDAMYDIINADGIDIADWYNEILPDFDSTVTLKEFRQSFLEHLGIDEVDTSLVNDDMVVEKTIETSSLSGQRVITAICEINGVFAHITRDGKLEYIQLEPIEEDKAFDIPINMYSDYEDFETQVINCLQIREDDTDPGVIYGSGANRYIIQGNFLLYGKTTSDLITITANLYPIINRINYRPSTITAPGNPCLEVGDIIHLSTKYQEIYTYVLQRNLSGIQALTDTYTANGTETYVDDGGSLQEKIEQVRSRTSELASEVKENTESINIAIESIEADYANILVLEAEVANIQTLFAEYATIQELYAALAEIDELYVDYEEVNNLVAQSLEAVYASIEALDADMAHIAVLLGGEAGIADLETIHLSTSNAIIDEAVITEALIGTVLADIITSNIIYTDTITIMSENGGIIIAGTTMQFSDANGTVRLQLGEDADGNFTFVLYDETGTGIMIDSEGIHASAVPDGLIVDQMVADDANIAASKLDIEDLTRTLNENGQLVLTAEQITIGGGTLDYALTEITQQIEDLESMGIESIVNYYAYGTDTTYPPFEWGDDDSAILGEGILGMMILGVNGDSNWSTEQPPYKDGEYVWWAQKITYVDGTVVWTEPALWSDNYLRNTITIVQTELEVIQGQISMMVSQTEFETATSEIWEQIQTVSNEYADIVIDVNSIKSEVGELTTTVGDHYEELSYEISSINIDLGSITSTVASVEESVKNLENYAVTNTTVEYYKSTSSTECVGGSWSTTAPEEEDGYFIWMRVTITYGIGTESSSVTSDPICLTTTGELSVKEIIPYYCVIESSTMSQPHEEVESPALVDTALVDVALVGITGIWTDEQPEYGDYEYLWESFLIIYTNGLTSWTEPTCLTDITIREQVTDLQASYSQIAQTVDSITLTVSDLQNSYSQIEQTINSISLTVSGGLGSTASIVMKVGDNSQTASMDLSKVRSAFANDSSSITISAGTITFNSGTIVINSTYFSVTSTGVITATSGTIGGWTITSGQLRADSDGLRTAVQAPSSSIAWVFAAGGDSSATSYSNYPFRVDKKGNLYATSAEITGKITASSGTIGGWTLTGSKIYGGTSSTGVAVMQVPSSSITFVFAAGGSSHDNYSSCPFRVTKAGALYATNASISGSITSSTISGTTMNGGTIYGTNYYTTTGNDSSIFTEGFRLYESSITAYGTSLIRFRQSSDSSTNMMRIRGMVESDGVAFGFQRIDTDLYLQIDNLYVTGSKSRLVETNDYGQKSAQAYETATPYFGDIGSGKTDENGICYISIDDVFTETVNTAEYVVFLQKEGQGDLWVKEKQADYFIIEGTPNLSFAWEIKAVQRDYETVYMSDPGMLVEGLPNGELEEDFDDEINEIDKELEDLLAV